MTVRVEVNPNAFLGLCQTSLIQLFCKHSELYSQNGFIIESLQSPKWASGPLVSY